jgi:hypothetical protein
MPDAATMMEPALHPGGQRRGQDPDHRQSPRGDSSSSISLSSRGHDLGQGGGDLQDILCTKDAHDRIKNHREERDRADRKRHNERDYDFHGPYYDQPARRHSPTRRCNAGGIKPFSRDLRRVR